MSCATLVPKYISQNPNSGTLPGPNASAAEKRAWLLTSQWECVGKACSPTDDPEGKTFSLKGNSLKENGFLAWVNAHSMKCINKVRGKIWGLDPDTGLTKQPGSQSIITSATYEFPPSACHGECNKVSDLNSDDCFNCVRQYVQDNPDVCADPDIDWTNSDNLDMLKDGTTCLNCIGSQAQTYNFGLGASSDTADADIHRVWNCITGQVSSGGLNGSQIAAIVSGVIFLLAIIIAFVILWYEKKKQQTPKDQTPQKETYGLFKNVKAEH